MTSSASSSSARRAGLPVTTPKPIRRLVASANKRVFALRPPVVHAARYGARWALEKDDWIDARLINRQPFEEPQLTRFLQRLDAGRIDTMIDVGANFGLYAVLAGAVGRVETIHAFEPVPGNVAKIEANAALNGLDQRLTVHAMALGDAAGEATLHTAHGSSGISRFDTDGSGFREALFDAEITVPVARLDDVVSLTGRRVFLKVDVEGHERPALAGMERLLADNTVDVQVESFADARADVEAFFTTRGYRPDGAIDEDRFFTNQPANQPESPR